MKLQNVSFIFIIISLNIEVNTKARTVNAVLAFVLVNIISFKLLQTYNKLFFLVLNKRNEFSITNIAAPVSLNTANQSVSNPGNTKIKAIILIIIEKYIFCLIIFLALLLIVIVSVS